MILVIVWGAARLGWLPWTTAMPWLLELVVTAMVLLVVRPFAERGYFWIMAPYYLLRCERDQLKAEMATAHAKIAELTARHETKGRREDLRRSIQYYVSQAKFYEQKVFKEDFNAVPEQIIQWESDVHNFIARELEPSFLERFLSASSTDWPMPAQMYKRLHSDRHAGWHSRLAHLFAKRKCLEEFYHELPPLP